MAQSLVAADLDLAANIALDLAAQVTFDLVVALDVVAQGRDVLVGEILGAKVRADAGFREDRRGASTTDAENVGKRNLHPLVAGEINAGKACHMVRSFSVLR